METLVVKQAFDGYARGDRITDPATIAKILESDNKHHVIKSIHETGPVQDEEVTHHDY